MVMVSTLTSLTRAIGMFIDPVRLCIFPFRNLFDVRFELLLLVNDHPRTASLYSLVLDPLLFLN